MMEKFLQKKGSKSKQLFLSLVVVCEVTFGDDDVIISGALKALVICEETSTDADL